MFNQTFVPDSNRTRSGASLFISFAMQAVVILVLVVIPLIYTEVLPRATLTSLLTAPPPPLPPPPPPPVAPKVVKVAPRQLDGERLLAPKQIPKVVALIIEDELPPATNVFGVTGSIPDGVPGGSGNNSLSSLLRAVAPPVAPPPSVNTPKPINRQPVRVSSGVIQALLIKRVVPVYPPLARQARIQGTVRFTAIIGKDGSIQNLQLISGHPLLVPAATEAIKQWIYKPTVLNTEPVEVITQIDFTFTLGGQ
jgi:protein TonB